MRKTDKKKICMLVHQDYFRDGRVRRYAESLAENGIRSDIICVKGPEGETTTSDNIRVFPVPLTRGYKKSRYSYILEYILIMVLFSIRLFFLDLKNHYDIIHVHNMPDFLVFSTILQKIRGAKIILDIHDPMPEFFVAKFSGDKDSKVVRLLKYLEKLSVQYVDAVITANENFKRNLVARGYHEDKITVVINVPDQRIFSRINEQNVIREDQDKFILIYPGTIAKRYGLDVAISALPIIREKIPNILLRIVGTYNFHVDELFELALKKQVTSNIEFRPVVPIEEVAGVITQADIGIYPAFPDVHMDIATPSKVLEFAFMGIPVIASRLTVLVDYFTEQGLVFFTPGNVDEFAACVIDLYENPQKRIDLVKQADQVFVNCNDWQKEMTKYLNLLDNLLGQ